MGENIYGYCPTCGEPGELRERRPNGNDTCEAGHTYPSRAAIQKKHSSLKQVIVMRTDLNMRKGKMIAQGAHASMQFLRESARYLGDYTVTTPEFEWLQGDMTKICVQVNSEKKLFDIVNKAKELGLEAHLVQDLAHTEFKVPTYTCAAIGPDEAEKVNEVTGGLKLL